MVLVFDTSTLITLHELGCDEMVRAFQELPTVEVVIPRAVWEELSRARSRINLSAESLHVEQAEEELPDDIPRRLGRGELEAIAIAYKLARLSGVSAIVLTDDKIARNKCKRIGVKTHGTLGLIELAKRCGIIAKERALQMLDEIPVKTHLYITRDSLEEARGRIQRQ